MPPDITRRYKNNPNFNLYEKEWIFHSFPPQGTVWLDFGCGTGEIASQLALLGARQVIAVDVAPGLVDMTHRRAQLDGVSDRVRPLCGDITALNPEKVDVALAFAVLHHLPDRLDIVAKTISRWLKPGGVFIFCEPVSYLPMLEWMRNHSGVPHGPVDPGERKLTSADLHVMERHFSSVERIHFNILTRLGRLIPRATHRLRRYDAVLRHIPASRLFAGTVIGICRK